MSLSERLRPDIEAAPWVIEEVKQLEALLLRVLVAEGRCPTRLLIDISATISAAPPQS